MCHRNSGIGGTGNRRCNSGNNFERDAGIDNRLGLLCAATENKWIAAFQTHDFFSGARFFNEQLVDFILSQRVLARLFSGVNNVCVIARPAQHFRVRQMIVNNDVSLLDALLRAQRHESKISRTGANKINLSALTPALAHVRDRICSNNRSANFSAFSLRPSTKPSRGAVAPRSKICARIFIVVPSVTASTPTGWLQSASNSRKNSRSARSASRVSKSVIASTSY